MGIMSVGSPTSAPLPAQIVFCTKTPLICENLPLQYIVTKTPKLTVDARTATLGGRRHGFPLNHVTHRVHRRRDSLYFTGINSGVQVAFPSVSMTGSWTAMPCAVSNVTG